ncbi:DUF1127 domain-containing protein [Dickeya chrysanthemi]|uniref:DUF1127 domain-containing protein n=1 Tax=Dickeya chrysanthemi TaxID=556 RepID=UPI0029904F3E|nr:DUF1127 domain-containing protein [Dickeya chrysanthemi]
MMMLNHRLRRTIMTPCPNPNLSPRRFLLLRLYRRLQCRYQQHQTRRILNALNDHRLRDIGLTREDIRRLYK